MSQIPNKMSAIEISEPGGPEVLKLVTRNVPEIESDEVLIKVTAAGVNRPDILQRQGLYPPPKGASDLLGLEVSGEVVKTGSDVTSFNLQDQVMALTPGGGYAQYVKVHASNTLPIPNGISLKEGAAIPETFFTVFSNIFGPGQLEEGETFLVHGGSSGIGTTAIQLAHAYGARVFTTVGSAEKKRFCENLGAELAVEYKKEDFVTAIKDATNGKGVDVILDMVGGDYVEKNWKVASVEGRILQIASLNGPAENVDFNRLMVKRLMHTGSTLRPRTTEFKAVIAEKLYENVWPLFKQGKIKPIIDSEFELKDVVQAHRRMESSEHIGKIILTLDT